jgi:hypothetical protein
MKYRLLATLCAGALAGLGLTTAGAGADDFAVFRSPTGGIGCVLGGGTLRCDVVGGIVPLPPMPRSCPFDWGQGFWMNAHGRAAPVCAGDTALNRDAPVVRYGTTWRHGAFACASSADGMRCKNADGHGFMIARGEASRF